jgi:hypothetical protein
LRIIKQTDGETYFFSAFILGHSMVNGLDVGLNADPLIKRGHKPNDQIKDMVVAEHLLN